MSFLNDISAHDDALEQPIWGAFTLFFDQIERLVLVNLLWALTLTPLLVAIGFPELPLWLRLALTLVSGLALAAASGALFRVAALVYERETVQVYQVVEAAREMWLPGLRALAPLLGVFGVLYWGTALISSLGLLPLVTLLQLCGVILLVSAIYWGPILAEDPERTPLEVARRALLLLWRSPAPTVATALVTLVVGAVGLVSVGGLFLAAPMVMTLLQTQRYQHLKQLRLRRTRRQGQNENHTENHTENHNQGHNGTPRIEGEVTR